MSAFGVKLPLTKDSADGFTSLKRIQDTVRQNLKMLILTNPGEKIMDVNYGVGIKSFLFSSRYNFTQTEIEQKIRDQVSFYMPAVIIRKIDFKFFSRTITKIFSKCFLCLHGPLQKHFRNIFSARADHYETFF